MRAAFLYKNLQEGGREAEDKLCHMRNSFYFYLV